MKTEKNKDRKYNWIWCISRHPVRYAMVIACMILAIPPALAMAVLVGYAIKQLQAEPTMVTWVELVGQHASRWIQPLVQGTELAGGLSVEMQTTWFPWILVGCSFFAAFFRGSQEYLLEDMGERIACRLRTSVMEGFLRLDYHRAAKMREGLLATMVGDDTREIRLTFTRMAGIIIADSLLSIVLLTWLILLDTQLFLLFFSVLLPAGIVIRVAGKKLKNLSRLGIEFQSNLLGALLEKLRGWQTIQVYKAFSFEIKRFNKINNDLFHTWRRAARARALASPMVEWLASIAAALVIVVALRRIAEQAITSSVFSSFLVTVALLANALQNITGQLNVSKKGLESLRRIREFLHEIPDTQKNSSKEITPEPIHSLEFRELVVANPETALPLTHPLNMSLAPGDVCAVVGPSGSGKSTLLRVLLGLESPFAGQVLINGRPAKEEDYQRYSPHLAFVPQDVFVFEGTVEENIVYPAGPKDLSETQSDHVRQALDRANLQKLPTDSIGGLSGGERQRLAFARTFFRPADLILIDEGTSALDLSNERLLLETLLRTAKNHIVFIIAHRPMVKEFASHILDLSGGAGLD